MLSRKNYFSINVFFSFFLSILFPAWGMEIEINQPSFIRLVKKTAQHQTTKKEKDCIQFVDVNGQLRHNCDVFYDIHTFKDHLHYIEKEYRAEMKQLQEKAYGHLKAELSKEFIETPSILPSVYSVLSSAYKWVANKSYLDKSAIETLFINYIDELNEEEKINVTGCSLSKDEWEDLKKYMVYCKAIYTDFSTRDFLSKQHVRSLEKEWDDIIGKKEKFSKLINEIYEIKEKYKELIDVRAVFEKKAGKNVQGDQIASMEWTKERQQIIENYDIFIKQLNNALSLFKYETIDDAHIENIYSVITKLESIAIDIDSKYSWYFNEGTNVPDSWVKATSNAINNLFDYTLPKFKGMYQLTPKAVVASSFLGKAGLLMSNNITILDIGFRNATSYGGFLNRTATAVFSFKSNSEAWFKEHGEVDYIAYIERDIKHKKDRLEIIYSGSNSVWDWGINFTVGHRQFHGLTVHDGIGWMVLESTDKYLSELERRINEFYIKHEKPNEFEIITAGHSLGAGLAELAAYYFKINSKKFNNAIWGDEINKRTISVKTFAFAAPAIIDSTSSEIIEKELGKGNIYRVWVPNDIIVTGTDNYIYQIFQNGVHIGKSIPLFNIQASPSNFINVMGPHGPDNYISYIELINPEKYTPRYQKFVDILNNYANISGLKSRKIQVRKLKAIREDHKMNALNLDYEFPQDLAEYIMKYSMTIFDCRLINESEQKLDQNILEYLINYPEDPRFKLIPIEDGAEVQRHFNTYLAITKAIHLQDIHLLNSFLNVLTLKNIFECFEEKEKKFENFELNLYLALKKFDERNTLGTPVDPYKVEVLEKYMKCLKQSILNVSWKIKEDMEDFKEIKEIKEIKEYKEEKETTHENSDACLIS